MEEKEEQKAQNAKADRARRISRYIRKEEDMFKEAEE